MGGVQVSVDEEDAASVSSGQIHNPLAIPSPVKAGTPRARPDDDGGYDDGDEGQYGQSDGPEISIGVEGNCEDVSALREAVAEAEAEGARFKKQNEELAAELERERGR